METHYGGLASYQIACIASLQTLCLLSQHVLTCNFIVTSSCHQYLRLLFLFLVCFHATELLGTELRHLVVWSVCVVNNLRLALIFYQMLYLAIGRMI
jgi:hypothetical protein